MGKKYVIEIEDEPFVRNDDPVIPHGVDELWGVKGFKSLVFDQYGLDQLEELNADYVNEHFGELQDTAYKSGVTDGLDIGLNTGRNEAWEAAKKIADYSIAGKLREALDTDTIPFYRYTAEEAIEKIKAYEEKQAAEIKIGDEVTATHGASTSVVIGFGSGSANLWYPDGTIGQYPVDKLKKTGRHFPQIAEMLETINKPELNDCSTCRYRNYVSGAKCQRCIAYDMWEPKGGNEHEAD